MPQLLALMLFALAAPATGDAGAQPSEAFDPSQVRRLSPEEKERILARNSDRATEAALNAAIGDGPSGSAGVHGELGVVVGTGGTSGIYGAAAIPLGDRGSASFYFEDFRTDLPYPSKGRRLSAPR